MSCNADLVVDVAEDGEEVVVAVSDADAPLLRTGGDDCQDQYVVQFDGPLGDRELIDGTTGEVVSVRRLPPDAGASFPYDRDRVTEAEYLEALDAMVSCLEAADPELDAWVYQALDWVTYRWHKERDEQGNLTRPPALDICHERHLQALEPSGSDPEEASGADCVPTIDASIPVSGDPNRRIEDIIEAMTGWSDADIAEGMTLEDEIDDPNFAGVYGDFRGGIIVTVVDCSLIDVDEIAEIAGGAEAVRIVEVPHNWREVNGFRDTLVAELRDGGIEGDVVIESTSEGRKIEVRTPDVGALPDGFGSTVPSIAYIIVETDDIFREQ